MLIKDCSVRHHPVERKASQCKRRDQGKAQQVKRGHLTSPRVSSANSASTTRLYFPLARECAIKGFDGGQFHDSISCTIIISERLPIYAVLALLIWQEYTRRHRPCHCTI